MVRVPQERGRKPAKKYMSDLNPTNLERQGYFGTDRRKPGSVRKPAASVMYDYTTGEVIHNFDVPDLVVAPSEVISIEPVITALPEPAKKPNGNEKARIAQALLTQYDPESLQQYDPQLFEAMKSVVKTQNPTIINPIDKEMTDFMQYVSKVLTDWVQGKSNATEAAIKQKLSKRYAEVRNRILAFVAENVSTPTAQPPPSAQPAEEVYEGQTDTNSGDNSPAPPRIPDEPMVPPSPPPRIPDEPMVPPSPPPGMPSPPPGMPSPPPGMPSPPPGMPAGHNPWAQMPTQELQMIHKEMKDALAAEPFLQSDQYFLYDYNMLVQELNNRTAAPMGRAQLAGVRQTTLRRMRQGAQVDVNQQVGDLFGAHNNVPHQHQVRQHTTESKESIDGLGSVFLKTRAAMGRLLG